MAEGADYHLKIFQLAAALGAKVTAAHATLVPIGYEGISMLIKQFPQPVLASGGEIETSLPSGTAAWEQAPLMTRFQGGFSIYETVASSASAFFAAVNAAGGYFDARIYEGTVDRHYKSSLLRRCFVTVEPPDRDSENRQMLLVYTGTLFGHYFGEDKPGNI